MSQAPATRLAATASNWRATPARMGQASTGARGPFVQSRLPRGCASRPAEEAGSGLELAVGPVRRRTFEIGTADHVVAETTLAWV